MSHRSWPDSLVILCGLIFPLNLSYPEKLSGLKSEWTQGYTLTDKRRC